jgi:isopenicillin-N epimerase
MPVNHMANRRRGRLRRRAQALGCDACVGSPRKWMMAPKGTGSVPVVEGLAAALRFIDKIGMPRIERWDAALTKQLRDGLAENPAVRLASPADPRLTAAITTFRVEGVQAKPLQDALWEKRVRVRAQSDERGVRLSAHLYVSPADVDQALGVTREIAAHAQRQTGRR